MNKIKYLKTISKIYETVSYINDKNSGWTYHNEKHIENNNITNEYYNWRYKGLNFNNPIRYPVGYYDRHKCICSIDEKYLKEGLIVKYDYVQARKEIYLKEYCRLVKTNISFINLKNRLIKGENIALLDVDGPHQESLNYYKEKYSVANNFIINDFMVIDKYNLQIMLYDTKHAFGHCYCLAAALLGIDNQL